jgi:hypothetical protein
LSQSARHAAQLFVYGGIMATMRDAWTDERMDDLVDRMESGFSQVNDRAARFEDRVDIRFDKIDQRFEGFDRRFEGIDQRFERFEERMVTRFEWLWRLMLAGYVAAVLGIVFG